MIENSHAFDAFICAYTAYLSFSILQSLDQKIPRKRTLD